MIKRDYQTLDAIIVIMAMVTVQFVLGALVFRTIPDSQLAIISGLGGTVLGVVLTYAAFRWQGNVDNKLHQPGTASVSIQATADTVDDKGIDQ